MSQSPQTSESSGSAPKRQKVGHEPDEAMIILESPLTADMFAEMFHIKVGSAPKPTATLPVHAGVAGFYSDFFAAALKKDAFKEGKDKCVELLNEDLDVVRQFVKWLYTGTIDDAGADYFFLYKVLIFADAYMVPLLANATLSRIRDKSLKTDLSPAGGAAFVYANTPEGSALRLFVTDIAVFNLQGGLPEYAKQQADWSDEILRDMMAAMWKHRRMLGSPEFEYREFMGPRTLCEYHTHPDGRRCY